MRPFQPLVVFSLLFVVYEAVSADYEPITQKKKLDKLYVTNDYLNISLNEYFEGYNLSYDVTVEEGGEVGNNVTVQQVASQRTVSPEIGFDTKISKIVKAFNSNYLYIFYQPVNNSCVIFYQSISNSTINHQITLGQPKNECPDIAVYDDLESYFIGNNATQSTIYRWNPLAVSLSAKALNHLKNDNNESVIHDRILYVTDGEKTFLTWKSPDENHTNDTEIFVHRRSK